MSRHSNPVTDGNRKNVEADRFLTTDRSSCPGESDWLWLDVTNRWWETTQKIRTHWALVKFSCSQWTVWLTIFINCLSVPFLTLWTPKGQVYLTPAQLTHGCEMFFLRVCLYGELHKILKINSISQHTYFFPPSAHATYSCKQTEYEFYSFQTSQRRMAPIT